MFRIFEEKRFDSAYRPGAYLDYLYYAPEAIKAPYPLVVYIHGAGSRGNSLDKIDRKSVV